MVLSSFGIKFSLDDFGTGYSNMFIISQIRSSNIKMDIFDDSLLKIIKAIKEMADAIGIEVIAEGVENERTVEILYNLVYTICRGFISLNLPRLRIWFFGEIRNDKHNSWFNS